MKYLLLTILLFPAVVFASPETYFLKLVNKERAKYDLAPLVLDVRLTESAEAKAEDMLKKQYMSHHWGKSYYDYGTDAGYDYFWFGENLACGFPSIKKTFKALMKSPTHRANLLDEKFKDTGIAVVVGNLQTGNCTDEDDLIIVQHFGVLQ